MIKEFEWQNERRGQQIEDFIHTAAIADPFLMREVLSIGLGDLQTWTDNSVVIDAKCGCLIGTCAIAASRLGRVDAQKVVERYEPDGYPAWGIVPLTLGTLLERITQYSTDDIETIGMYVADEADDQSCSDYEREHPEDYDLDARHDEVREYLEDLIAVDLRLLGVSVPRNKTRALAA